MKTYGSFCPVAKTAEIFAERWTPLLLRELCMGARRFSELQTGLPLISRSLLTQRLRELLDAGIVQRQDGGHGYRLTAAGEAFRPLIAMMAVWGQTHGQGRIAPEDTDPGQLVWGLRRHLDVEQLPERQLVVQFEFHGLPKTQRSARYWWLVLRRPDVEVCQKNPGYAVDVTVVARLQALTTVWLGYRGLAEAGRSGEVALAGRPAAIAAVRAALGLRDQPWQKPFDFSARLDDPFGPVRPASARPDRVASPT